MPVCFDMHDHVALYFLILARKPSFVHWVPLYLLVICCVKSASSFLIYIRSVEIVLMDIRLPSLDHRQQAITDIDLKGCDSKLVSSFTVLYLEICASCVDCVIVRVRTSCASSDASLMSRNSLRHDVCRLQFQSQSVG